MEDFGIFYGHLVYFMYGHMVYYIAIWYFLRPPCIFYGNLVFFASFGMLYHGKSGNPARDGDGHHELK
jgi:hypothetical protein